MAFQPIPDLDLIICAICGQRFSAAEQRACASCPLQRGCQLVCCPVCGYETVDLNRSLLAHAFKRLSLASRLQAGAQPIQRSSSQ